MKAGFTALVVDDDDFSRKTAVRLLHRLGARSVVEAADGRDALTCATAAGSALDLIICDLRMPKVDGIQTLRGLAAHNAGATIILASGADWRVLRSARDMGLAFGIQSLHCMGKPITLAKLCAIMDSADSLPSASIATGRSAPTVVSITSNEIKRGFDAGEFEAYYQPKVSISSRELSGAEALIRWNHPIYGLLPPGTFLSIAQEAGMLGEMTEFMVATAIAQCACWRKAGFDVSVSCNLPMSALHDRAFPDQLMSIMERFELPTEQLTLELTEDGWLQNQAIARETLTRLRVSGFGLSIDDFGTGYSTLQQLLRAPFNELKIDQSFVGAAPDDEEAAIAVESSISLARQLGLLVVAEGIETRQQWQFLLDAGCDEAQGYLISRPMPGSAFIPWGHEWRSKVDAAAGRSIWDVDIGAPLAMLV